MTPGTVAYQAPLSMGFPRQEYCTGLPFPPPGDLPNPGIKPESPVSPASPVLQVNSLPAEPSGLGERVDNQNRERALKQTWVYELELSM